VVLLRVARVAVEVIDLAATPIEPASAQVKLPWRGGGGTNSS
jgi:hypothetical protein